MTSPENTIFDATELGLLSHYGSEARFQIKKRMLDDWQASDMKLPTYMKLVARFIEKTGVLEEWLRKLSHQTMAKMLAGTSTPRHEFWTCLHLYLTKKYGPIDIEPSITDADILGQSFTRFARVGRLPSIQADYALGDGETLATSDAGNETYAYAVLERIFSAPEPFSVPMTTRFEGIVVAASQGTQVIVRGTNDRSLHFRALAMKEAK